VWSGISGVSEAPFSVRGHGVRNLVCTQIRKFDALVDAAENAEVEPNLFTNKSDPRRGDLQDIAPAVGGMSCSVHVAGYT
jgi:hypothetical protein